MAGGSGWFPAMFPKAGDGLPEAGWPQICIAKCHEHIGQNHNGGERGVAAERAEAY